MKLHDEFPYLNFLGVPQGSGYSLYLFLGIVAEKNGDNPQKKDAAPIPHAKIRLFDEDCDFLKIRLFHN